MLRAIVGIDSEDTEEEEEDLEAESPFNSMLESSVVAQGQAEDIELESVRKELEDVAHDTALSLNSLSNLSGFLSRLGYTNPTSVSITCDSSNLIRINKKIYIPNHSDL